MITNMGINQLSCADLKGRQQGRNMPLKHKVWLVIHTDTHMHSHTEKGEIEIAERSNMK